MPKPHAQSPRPDPIASLLPGALVLLVVSGALAPLLAGFIDAALHATPATASTPSPARWPLLASSLAHAALIAALASLLGLLQAPWVARAGWRAAAWVLLPTALPSYLAAAGWGLARAPDTTIGRWIEHAATSHTPWLPTLLSRALAIASLALWASPLVAVGVGFAQRRLDPSIDDALRLDAPPLARARARLAAVRASLALWAGISFLLMLGSPVPLHLAQIPTYATEVWLALVQDPGQGRALLSSWPLVLVALVAGWYLARPVLEDPGETDPPRAPAPLLAPPPLGFAVVLTLGVAAPWLLLLWGLKDASSIPTFLRASRGAILESASHATWTALACGVLGLGTWWSLASDRAPWRALARLAVRTSLVGGLTAGIVVGALHARVWALADRLGAPPGLVDSSLPIVLAHVARFGFVPALIAAYLARGEPASLRDLRRLEPPTLAAWLRAELPRGAWLLLAGMGLCWVLSFHEVEASILVRPPGTGGLAHQILGYLHYARTEELSAAGVVLVGASALLLALAASRGPARGEG